MIPEGWTERRLGELLDYEQPTKYLVKSTEYEESGTTPVLTAGKSFILGYTSESEGLYDKGPTILFDDFTTGTQWVDFPFKVKSSACKMLTTRDSGVSLRFIYELMKTISYVPADHMRHWIGIASQWTVAVPPAVEQRAIAEALSDAGALVESLDALIAKKRDMKQAAMQQLLTGRTRLPGFSDEWNETSLGDIARVKTGSRNNQDKVAGGRYPFYVRSAFVESIDSYSYEDEAILIPGEGGIGEIFHYMNGPHEVHQRVYRVSEFAAETCPRFVVLYLRSFFGLHALRNTVKATVDSLRLPTFLEFKLMLPSLKEQEAIAQVLWDVDGEIDVLVAQREKAELVKQGMMQELLSGRVRLA